MDCAFYLSIKMSIQRGLGHWKIAPIKKMRSTYLPEALHLLDRREVYKTIKKIAWAFGGYFA